MRLTALQIYFPLVILPHTGCQSEPLKCHPLIIPTTQQLRVLVKYCGFAWKEKDFLRVCNLLLYW